jgi:hypothetical protein
VFTVVTILVSDAVLLATYFNCSLVDLYRPVLTSLFLASVYNNFFTAE